MGRGGVVVAMLFSSVVLFYLDLTEASAYLSALAAIVVAIFTWTLTVTTVAMSDGAEAAAAEQREATERDQRGYVMYKQSAEVGNGELTMIWANFGRTPVKDVEPFVFASFVASEGAHPLLSPMEPPPTNVVAAERTKVCIAPGGEYWIRCQVPHNTQRWAHAMYGEYKAYLHGRVEYTDAFGKRRRTDFRYRIDTDGHPQHCDEGNDWT